jgi:amino acid permease
MCEIFLGKTSGNVYTVVCAVYLYGTLWAYTAVFGKAFATFLPFTGLDRMYHSYLVYLGIFACVVVPVSLMEFQEQIFVQVCLTVFRVVMLLVMVGTVLVAWYNEDNEFNGPPMTEGALPIPFNRPFEEIYDDIVWNVHFDKMYLLLPIAAYAYIFHHSVPSLSEPVEDKSKLPFIFNTALIISCVAYLLIGGIISTFMGDAIMPGSNLNWEVYSGRECDQHSGVPMYARLISLFVVLFPALDVASAYPLNAFTLGNTLMTFAFGSKRLNRMAKDEKREQARLKQFELDAKRERKRKRQKARERSEGRGDVELSNLNNLAK